MIGTFRKHSQVLWWIIIVAIIITFVYWGSNTSQQSGGGGRNGGNYGVLNGEVITPTMLELARREARLGMAYNRFYSSGGRWTGASDNVSGQDLEVRTYQRIFLIQKARELGIEVSDEAVLAAANRRMSELARGNPVPAADFEREVLARDRLTLADFERFIRNEIAIQQLATVVAAGADLLPPAEVEKMYRREFQPVSAQVVFFRATNDLAGIAVTPEALGQFYTNRLAEYRLPDRVQVSYVRYPLSNFLAAAQTELNQNTNLSEFIEVRFEQMGLEAFPGVKTPEEAKQKIREEFERNLATEKAGQEANKLGALLYDRLATNYTAAGFAAIAQEQGLKAEVTAPFGVNGTPDGLDVSGDFARRAFNLNLEEPFSEPLAGRDHVYLLGYNRQLPSEIPSLDSIRARVTTDYQYVQAAMAAQQAGMKFAATVSAELTAGKTFSNVCAQAGYQPLALAPFYPASRSIPEVANQVNEQEFKRAVFTTNPGTVTPLLQSADGAALAFVAQRLPVDEAAMRTNLPAFAQEVQQARRNEIFEAWFRQEGEKALTSLPYFQKQAELSGMPN
jgi:hypothetical protein